MYFEWVLPCCYRGTISRNAATTLGTNRAGSNGIDPLESPGAVVTEDHAMLLNCHMHSLLFLRAEGFDGPQYALRIIARQGQTIET